MPFAYHEWGALANQGALMIAHLRGVITSKEAHRVVLDVGGVGYQVFISLATYESLPATGETVQLLITTYVREDLFHLYGFATRMEQEFFSILMGVNGIGTKLALSALSTLTPSELTVAIVQGDVNTLARISGVGRRIAQRLVVELKDRLPGVDAALASTSAALPETSKSSVGAPATLRSELTSALVNLGYKGAVVDHVVKVVLDQGINDLPIAIRLALRHLSQ
ncbi:MAG: Holliday junction branch migration protein RuvA [Magnetococcus sp. DMHC-6]